MTRTIFDLPEILLSIAIHLAPADLAQACCVSRGWFVPFASKLWYSIQQDQWTDGNLLLALPRYAVFVRELRCPLYLPSNSLGHLFSQLTLFSAPRLIHDNQDTITQILKRNPNIQSLSLSFDSPRSYERMIIDVFQTVSGMTKLKELKLRELVFAPGNLGSLLDQLLLLESLTLEKCGHEYPATNPEEIPEDTVSQLEHPRQGQQLRSLQMDGNLDCFEIILEIAWRSPLLERLVLVNMTTYDLMISSRLAWYARNLGSQCQHLDQLVISGCEVNAGGLVCLLSAFPKLKKLQVMDVPMKHSHVLRSLINHKRCRDILEEVSIEKSENHLEGSLSVTTSVLALLAKFKKLRKVHLRQCRVLAPTVIFYQRRYGSIVASKDLEVLEITLTGPRKSWVPAEVQSMDAHTHWTSSGDADVDEKPDHSIYHEIMEGVRRLPKLDSSTIRFF
ncbi:MAG: hypothetical protein J3Q66DRAFT_330808 [Benniella sp.]|nr:MAG: hypothetical protein J3Q66DRAFT_330808 [Benniella sp.]